MIITRTPLRVSFAGGGTDLPAFYKKEVGAVVSTTIDKYVYLSVHPFFSDEIQLKYSKTETVSNIDQIEMRVFREALKLFGIKKKIEIVIVADLPKEGGSGLGGSTAFSVGLLNALSLYVGKQKSQIDYAKMSTDLELDILKNPIGKQDQYASAVGGLNFISFNPDDTVTTEPIFLNQDVRNDLQDNLLMFFTGKTRNANSVLSEQQQRLSESDKLKLMQRMRDLAIELKNELQSNKIDSFGEILHENWNLKKQLTTKISDPQIDDWYKKGIAAGAEGGKILGAGGGGFLLFYCQKDKQDALRAALSDLKPYPFRFENQGTRVILFDDNQSAEKVI